MQILGLSESTPKSENRLKSLFWPRVRYTEDVELLGTQGYWVCVVVACSTVLIGLSTGHGIASLVDSIFYYLSGVGIRRGSRFAAVAAFLIYLLGVIVNIRVAHNAGIGAIFFLALLLANVRATWLAKRFVAQQAAEGLVIPQPTESVFTDKIPRVVWPIARWLYYVLACLMLLGTLYLLLQLH
jgi:hypothetical protein